MFLYDLVELSTDIPVDFDPRTHPIIAAHFFGLIALPPRRIRRSLGADFGETEA